MSWPTEIFSYWFVIARSLDITSKPLSLPFFSKRLVAVRDAESILVTWDRCPHRNVPLSEGCLTATGLQCPYHGWTFAMNGRCVAVPGSCVAHSDTMISLKPFAVIECDGWVWVRASHAEKRLLPVTASSLDDSSRYLSWQGEWSCHIADALENMLDPFHTHFVHAGWVRHHAARRRMRIDVQEHAEGVVVDYIGQDQQSGWIFKLLESRRTIERAHFDWPGSVQLEYAYENGSTILINLHFTPATLNSTRLFASLHVKGRSLPRWLLKLLVWPLLHKVARQDRHILQSQMQNRLLFAGARDAVHELDFARHAIDRLWRTELLADRCARNYVGEALI